MLVVKTFVPQSADDGRCPMQPSARHRTVPMAAHTNVNSGLSQYGAMMRSRDKRRKNQKRLLFAPACVVKEETKGVAVLPNLRRPPPDSRLCR
jgi:hypothetical protein